MSEKSKRDKKGSGDSSLEFSGFEDKSGPQESIDLSDVKEELVSVAEGEEKVTTSTPLVTPVTSPDRQACIESNSVKKSKELFEALQKTETKASTKAARELVVPIAERVISPIRSKENLSGVLTTDQSDLKSRINTSSLDFSDTESCASDIASMGGVDEASCQRFCDKLLGLIKTAEDDIKKAKALYDSPERKPATLRATQSRLEAWNERLLKTEKEVHTYKGKSIDTSVFIIQSEDCRMDLVEYKVLMDEAVKEVSGALEKPKGIPGVRMVKTTASTFPVFDGMIDYDIWETSWTELADNSGLSEAGLLIKLRESLVDKAKDYIGVSGMANLSYEQTWEKLRERYNVAWARTQQAARKFFNIPTPSNDDQSVIKYIDAVRDSVDAIERAGLTPENIFFNIALDNLPERVRVPLVEKLEVQCEDFKFSKALFEKQFSKTMSLLENKPNSLTASMYSTHIGNNTPNTPVNDKNKGSYPQHQPTPDNPSQGNNNHQYQGGYRGRGGFRGRGYGYKGNGKKPPNCTLCHPFRHYINDCKYKTPAQRRKRLVDIGRCQACLIPIREHGADCSHKVRCPHHEGERHVPWTCDGVGSDHPGPQKMFPLPARDNSST